MPDGISPENLIHRVATNITSLTRFGGLNNQCRQHVTLVENMVSRDIPNPVGMQQQHALQRKSYFELLAVPAEAEQIPAGTGLARIIGRSVVVCDRPLIHVANIKRRI